MSFRELQPEQAAAAHEISKHISVTAGPGSGKTTVLVERYLHILRQHDLSIDQIVAITFTNRAANEMRERLRTELNLILQTTSETARPRWLNYKRTLDGAVITTIHGFCARLLREFPVEARIDPQFVLFDEHRAAMLLESVVEETLSQFISSGHVEISRLTLGVGRSKLAAALAQIYRDMRGQGLSIDELAMTTARSHATDEDYAAALAETDIAMRDLLAVKIATPKARAKQLRLSAEWPTMRSLLHEIPEPERLADYCRAVEDFRNTRPDARSPIAEQVKALDELIWGKESLGRVPQVCLDLFARQYALEIVNLLTRINERLNEEKQKLSALDFDDLELRALALLEQPEVLARTDERYKFFLVDEFQDTNGLQRRLLERLVLAEGKRQRANLFIVGDPKQSIYAFRGADVDVFQQMSQTLITAGGEPRQLHLNFRSQPQLISFFNFLFERLFQPPDGVELAQLGYVAYERSEPKREPSSTGPLVELMIATKPSVEDHPNSDRDLRELDAEQLALRINSLIGSGGVHYSGIALLFRAMTQVWVYESAFRRANIPYQTVLGRGFYERPEIVDLVQLLRFLDNRTDELALAAILRSPLCGVSDNALFALRNAPCLNEVDKTNASPGFSLARGLYQALGQHREIAFIKDEEHYLLDRAASLLKQLIARRHHYSIEDLLRFAVDQSEFMMVVAANFDGAQRLANVQRLFTLAARFEGSGVHLIRDFVRYVEEFEAIGSRESEGQIDETANSVRLMTIHQAKGLEFPVVIIPELHRLSKGASDRWFELDRHHGLTLKVPDGRGRSVAGATYSKFEQRHAWREQFESMRLLYVAATRAKDQLILSGATDKLASLDGKNDSWLKWIWQSLKLDSQASSGIVQLSDDAQLQLTLNLEEEARPQIDIANPVADDLSINEGDSLLQAFPLLQPLSPSPGSAAPRFSVTQLINYQRCPRQYYFDRILKLPSADELAVWNNAEAPEPPANLTATLKGAVIHRFCERYSEDQEVNDCLRRSFDEVVRLRQAELADRLVEIDPEGAIRDLLPLAENYLASDVFVRIEQARKASANQTSRPTGKPGLWSELSFRLRRPSGVLSGAIDKLLVTLSPSGAREVEIIDFKTNRITAASRSQASSSSTTSRQDPAHTSVKTVAKLSTAQFAFNFDAAPPETTLDAEPSLDYAISVAANDYQLQMQAYALAVRELVPSLSARNVRVTLHFLAPNLEFHLSEPLLETGACKRAIDEAMQRMVSASHPEHYPVRPASHCRMCNFLSVCAAGRQWSRLTHPGPKG